jgi:hypothetical protein
MIQLVVVNNKLTICGGLDLLKLCSYMLRAMMWQGILDWAR